MPGLADDPLALPDYQPLGQVALTDAERWPDLSASGRARLTRVAEHPAAPPWVHRTGHRLGAAAQSAAAVPDVVGDWLPAHLSRARGLLAYRGHPGPLEELADFPFVSREDLVDDIAAYVPADAPLDRVLHGTSSGSTGAALVVPDDPDELARGFHWLVRLVRSLGVDWAPDPDRMGLLHTVHQHQAFSYVSVLPGFGDATMARVNVHPDQWTAPGQREAFLAALDPQVVTGTPASLEALLDAPLAAFLRPLALVSGATALTAPLRAALEAQYGVPVVDIYGLHETRPVAVSVDGGPFRIVDRRVHVEVLDAQGRPVAPGDVGEIVVTAGENTFLPLVRYRTGDHARLVEVDGQPALADLEGRASVVFVAADGSTRGSVDLTQQLQAAGARGWSVTQAVDGTVSAQIAGGDAGRAKAALSQLLGQRIVVRRVERVVDLGPGKPRRFASEA